MDLDKYRALFRDESAEHLTEISRALLELEKDPSRTDSIDVVFRMAHSIKGMALSLDYGPVAEAAHVLEDRMQASRPAGQVDWETLTALFRDLERLEGAVAAARDPDRAPRARPGESGASAAASVSGSAEASGKKAPGPP